MSDIKEILESVLHDEKLLSSKAFRERVYSDQLILRPASQIKRPETPAKLREMKALAYTPEAYWKTSAWLFVQQGQFMADYEDSFPTPEEFEMPFPTYRDMTSDQLRGYFAWRSALRRGSFQPAPLPFLTMYAFEQINLIGTDSPEEAFCRLGQLRESYPQREELCRRILVWQRDLAVRYELPREIFAELPDLEIDRLLMTLIRWDKTDDGELFSAITQLSAYRPDSSRLFAEQPELFRAGVCAAYRRLAEFYRDKRKNSLFEKLFGKLADSAYHLFADGIYYERKPDLSLCCALSDIQIYTCEYGRWSVMRFHNRGRSKALGEVVRTVDSLLREISGYRFKVGLGEVSKQTCALLKKELEGLWESRKRSQAVKIEFDLSKLNAIRAASEATCEKLIVDEEELPELTAAEEEPAAEETSAANVPLSPGELPFLRALLTGGDWAGAARSAGSMASLLADSINDRLFDRFGDTVIEFCGEAPQIIEDYAEELRELLGLR
ncbi:MAG: TerB N-terminal domain-containing protein [Ruminococcus sp.]|nr:TerB N-terminal domain-containing protein [Ruminococcus sp.]